MLYLKFERQRQALSQTAIGRAARIPQPTYSAIETGRLKPTPAQLQRLAAVFRVQPPEALLAEAER